MKNVTVTVPNRNVPDAIRVYTVKPHGFDPFMTDNVQDVAEFISACEIGDACTVAVQDISKAVYDVLPEYAGP